MSAMLVGAASSAVSFGVTLSRFETQVVTGAEHTMTSNTLQRIAIQSSSLSDSSHMSKFEEVKKGAVTHAVVICSFNLTGDSCALLCGRPRSCSLRDQRHIHFWPQVHLRGQSDFDHKLQAAAHIFNTWTAQGAEPAALASRYRCLAQQALTPLTSSA